MTRDEEELQTDVTNVTGEPDRPAGSLPAEAEPAEQADMTAAKVETAAPSDAMRLLEAVGGIDERFVLEAEVPAGDETTGETQGRAGRILRFGPSQMRLIAGVGLAACLLVAGVVVFAKPSLLSPSVGESVGQVETAASDADGGAAKVASDAGEDAEGAARMVAGDAAASGAEAAVQDATGGDAAAVALSSTESADEASVGGVESAVETGRTEALGSAESADETAMLQASSSLANPWVECADLGQAQAEAGFTFEVGPVAVPPDADVQATYIQAIPGELIEVDYFNADGNRLLYLRKALGTDDVSGDYNAYGFAQTCEVDGVEVSLRGEDGSWHVATWTRDGYSYAACSDPGLTTAQVEKIVSAVK